MKIALVFVFLMASLSAAAFDEATFFSNIARFCTDDRNSQCVEILIGSDDQKELVRMFGRLASSVNAFDKVYSGAYGQESLYEFKKITQVESLLPDKGSVNLKSAESDRRVYATNRGDLITLLERHGNWLWDLSNSTGVYSHNNAAKTINEYKCWVAMYDILSANVMGGKSMREVKNLALLLVAGISFDKVGDQEKKILKRILEGGKVSPDKVKRMLLDYHRQQYEKK